GRGVLPLPLSDGCARGRRIRHHGSLRDHLYLADGVRVAESVDFVQERRPVRSLADRLAWEPTAGTSRTGLRHRPAQTRPRPPLVRATPRRAPGDAREGIEPRG